MKKKYVTLRRRQQKMAGVTTQMAKTLTEDGKLVITGEPRITVVNPQIEDIEHSEIVKVLRIARELNFPFASDEDLRNI